MGCTLGRPGSGSSTSSRKTPSIYISSSLSTSHTNSGQQQQQQQPNQSMKSAGSSTPRNGGGPDAIRSSFLAGTLTPDPRCPLDARQMYGLSKTWKAINRNMSVTAINIFVRLFETNTDIKEMFSNMKDLQTIADLRSSKMLEAHAMKVLCTIDDAIVNMDDMDYVIRLLQLSAQSHCHRFPHFNSNYFWRIEEPFILAVKDELGDRFTISVENAYRAMIRFILAEMTTEIQRCQSAAVSSSTTTASPSTHAGPAGHVPSQVAGAVPDRLTDDSAGHGCCAGRGYSRPPSNGVAQSTNTNACR